MTTESDESNEKVTSSADSLSEDGYSHPKFSKNQLLTLEAIAETFFSPLTKEETDELVHKYQNELITDPEIRTDENMLREYAALGAKDLGLLKMNPQNLLNSLFTWF